MPQPARVSWDSCGFVSAGAALAPLVLAAACAHTPCPGGKGEAAAAPALPPAPTAPEPRGYAVHDGKSGAPLDEDGLDARLRRARVVYVGEHHDDPHHHYVQVQVLERLHGLDPSVGIGLEMLPVSLQGPLAAFVAGETEAPAFKKAVDWDKTWGFPFGFYEPLLRFCRAHGLPAFALNAPRAITRAVARGEEDDLSAEQRALVPQLVPGPAEHREFVREAFGAHARSRFTGDKFERFYRAQLTWDETMAQSVVNALAVQGAPNRLVVIAGEGHTRPFAMPQRVARRGVEGGLTVLAIEPDQLDDAVAEQAADILFVFEAEAETGDAGHGHGAH